MPSICPRCSELLPDDAGFCPFDGAPVQKSSDRFLGRTIAARYRLTKKLGAGGMSVVYLARHELISRLSAIKILRPELSRVPEHRERFLREARAVNRINHENIVEITDVGESDGIAYLVMEYVEGESLLAQIQRGPMAWERGARISIQVASALARTHQTAIIHRDLKPENILLVPRTSRTARARAPSLDPIDELVKLTDFGIAKMMGEPTLTLNEQLFGTPGYIAPEYVNGLAIDGRADLYSLAVVLYEMVTGQLPFEGRGQSDLLLKPLTSTPIPPSRRVSGLPPELEALILRTLSRDPGERPHDAFAFHDALLDILRRHGSSSPSTPEVSPEPSAQATAREPMATVIDSVAAHRVETADVGGLVTRDIGSRWATALADLEMEITTARREGGARAVTAGRAAELASVAVEMIPRLERANGMVAELQARVDGLEVAGREFRADLGRAIDVLVHDRSRERAQLDALGARSAPGEEVRRAESVVADLTYQIDTLQKQLDARNEEHERKLMQATGSLEGALSALRRLAIEISGTIDDGIAMLAAS